MFSLDGTVKYWLYSNLGFHQRLFTLFTVPAFPKPVDMRKSVNGLSGIVTNGMYSNFRNGDVYIFMNASRNMMKMLRREEGGLVLYAIRLDMGRMKPAAMASDGEVTSSGISYEDMLGMVRSALDSPYVRRMRMLSKSF